MNKLTKVGIAVILGVITVKTINKLNRPMTKAEEERMIYFATQGAVDVK